MRLLGPILYGADDAVAGFVAARIPHAGEGFGACTALGVVRDGRLTGGIVYHNWRGRDIEVSAAFERADWARPSVLRALFAYPFDQLGCARMTALTGRANGRARRFLEGVGFVREGVARQALADDHDMMIYGMLRRECRFLKGYDHGIQDPQDPRRP
jgi:RimJ/RimL family protein N-acetyltransferase